MLQKLIASVFLFGVISCNGQPPMMSKPEPALGENQLVTGAENMEKYLPLLRDKRVALLVNQTARVGETHLVDTLLSLGIKIQKVFGPEHGFRGAADAGEHVDNATDKKTGLPIVSLYGSKKAPSKEDLADVDVVIFDIQDVGVRFFTFISSLHYLMEACADNDKDLIVLDRPNPNGWYIDGPVLKKEFQSFVGVDPIPVVHGLTVGEYANMVNGEGWLGAGKQCRLSVITCTGYRHKMHYSLPVKPSPNLPNDAAVYLYPSICYFEGTDVSVGRGTDYPFQVVGSPKVLDMPFSFTPESKPGAKTPPHLNEKCFGLDLRKVDIKKPGIDLSYLQKMYEAHTDKEHFFLANNFFEKLAGTADLRKQLQSKTPDGDIKAGWRKDLEDYKAMRRKYLLYPDFE